jgi:hypothetical protein
MSETTTEVEPTTEEVSVEPPKANKEARYRVERNTAREQLATATARIDAMNRAEISRLAGEHLAQGSDLLGISGDDLASFLTESGEIDAELVAEAAAELVSTRPGLKRQSAAHDPSQGSGGAPTKSDPSSWADLFKS